MSTDANQDRIEELDKAIKKAAPSVQKQSLQSEAVAELSIQFAKQLETELSMPELAEKEAPKELLDKTREDLTQAVSTQKAILDNVQAEEKDLIRVRSNLAVTVQTTAQQVEQTLSDYRQRWEAAQKNLNQQAENLLSSFSDIIKRFTTEVRQGQDKLLEDLDNYTQVSINTWNALLQEEEKKSRAIEALTNKMQQQIENLAEHSPIPIKDSHTRKTSQGKSSTTDRAKEAQLLAQMQVARHQLNQQREDRLRQARTIFMVALTLLTLGILLVFAGVVCIYTINLTVGAITTVSGTIVDILSAIVLRFNRETNDRLDNITKELSILDRTAMAMHYIGYISDAEKKDQAIADLTRQLYTLPANQAKTRGG